MNMAIYGYVRCSPKEKPPEVQIPEIAKKAGELGGSLTGVFIDPGSSGKRTAVLGRPAGKEMLQALKAGDTLIVHRLDRLGYSMPDIQKTVEALCDRGVRLYLLRALDAELDLAPANGKIFLQLFALQTKAEKALRSERATESARWRKQVGLAYCNPPTARKIVERNGMKVLEWDMEQLEYIAQIAERIAKEPAEKIAKDFWARGIKDRHGRPWGKQTPRPFRRYRSPYQQFYRAAQWFHRMKRKGLLPTPYCELGLLMQEPKRFRLEPKAKTWTRGGTARLEQERADSKARHHAERLARWQNEKATRIQARVRKPTLVGLGIVPQPIEGDCHD
jgi:DNA invertase Pin-like site-specific DNA recombinase